MEHQNSIRTCLKLLQDEKHLSPDQISACMDEIMTSKATLAQIGAFLVSLRKFTPEIIYHSAKTMASFSIPCPVSGDVLDIVGTGGDQIDTFNVSTASGFILAACGQKVAKHGNRSSSGRCGAADLVEALGVNLNLEPQKLSNIVEKLGFGFLFAQKFHPAMKSVAPIRKEIGVRTIFNVLGPLTNPAKPAYIVAGVGTKELGDLYSKVLRLAGMKGAWVVHSEEGMDEISPAGNTHVWSVKADGSIEEFTIHPSDFGLPAHPIESVAGSTPDVNCGTFHRILSGEERGPVLDFLLMNSAAALHLVGKAADLKDAVRQCRAAIESGKAKKLVEEYIAATHSAQ